MSFYTSLTGLGGAQADLSATSNNIANVGTTGFKRSRAEFGDIFATSPLQNSSSAIGSGPILKSIKQQFTQGNIASSLNALDMAISGQGFFALKPTLTSTQTVYTRNGSFSVNNDRYVIFPPMLKLFHCDQNFLRIIHMYLVEMIRIHLTDQHLLQFLIL